MTERFVLSSDASPDEVNDMALMLATILARGSIIAFPADTVWGLGVAANRPDAVERLRHVKGRRDDHPFPVYVESHRAARKLCGELNQVAETLACSFWPGGLTIVLPLANDAYRHLEGNDGSVGIRVPDSNLFRTIPQHLKCPFVNTSANMTGRPPLETADDVIQVFGSCVDAIVVNNAPLMGTPSTVVRPEKNGCSILRQGAVSEDDLHRALLKDTSS